MAIESRGSPHILGLHPQLAKGTGKEADNPSHLWILAHNRTQLLEQDSAIGRALGKCNLVGCTQGLSIGERGRRCAVGRIVACIDNICKNLRSMPDQPRLAGNNVTQFNFPGACVWMGNEREAALAACDRGGRGVS